MQPFRIVTPTSYDQNPSQRRQKRSGRAQTSCAPCRRAKTRCDQGRPCRTCVINERQDDCIYTLDSASVTTNFLCENPVLNNALTPTKGLQRHLRDSQGSEAHVAGLPYQKGHVGTTSLAAATSVGPASSSSGSPEESMNYEPFHGYRSERGHVGTSHWMFIARNMPEICLYMAKDPMFQKSWQLTSSLEDLFQASQTSLGPHILEWNPSAGEILSAADVDYQFWHTLCGNFWSSVGQMIPILDKPSFEGSFQELCSSADCEEVTFSLQLIVIFGIGYMVDGSRGELDIDSSLKQNKARNLVNMSKAIVLTHSKLRNPSMSLLELYLLIDIADSLLSEIDGPDATGPFFAIALRASLTLGLHLTTAIHPDVSEDQREKIRHLWTVLRILDSERSTRYGTPPELQADRNDCSLSTLKAKEHVAGDEKYTSIWFKALANLTTASASLVLAAQQRIPTSAAEVVAQCARFQESLASLKSELDKEISVLSATWIACGQPSIFTFQHLYLNVIWCRTRMLLYQTCLSGNANGPHLAWPHFIGAATALLASYHDYIQGQPNLSMSWWTFYHSFIRHDICRAVFGLCYAIRRMTVDCLSESVDISSLVQVETPSQDLGDPSGSRTEDIKGLLVLIEKTRDTLRRSILVGMEHVRSLQLLNIAAVGVYSLIVGDNAIAKMQSESERFLDMAYRIKFDSLPRDIIETNGICRDLDVHENGHINIDSLGRMETSPNTASTVEDWHR